MSSTLQQGEDLAAKGAMAPRVMLAAMEDRIVEEYYFTAGRAVTKLCNTIGSPQLDVMTICVCVLDNGWVLLGKSAPADPANYDVDKGATFARDDALRQMWPLEGYLLREKLSLEYDHGKQRYDP